MSVWGGDDDGPDVWVDEAPKARKERRCQDLVDLVLPSWAAGMNGYDEGEVL